MISNSKPRSINLSSYKSTTWLFCMKWIITRFWKSNINIFRLSQHLCFANSNITYIACIVKHSIVVNFAIFKSIFVAQWLHANAKLIAHKLNFLAQWKFSISFTIFDFNSSFTSSTIFALSSNFQENICNVCMNSKCDIDWSLSITRSRFATNQYIKRQFTRFLFFNWYWISLWIYCMQWRKKCNQQK